MAGKALVALSTVWALAVVGVQGVQGVGSPVVENSPGITTSRPGVQGVQGVGSPVVENSPGITTSRPGEFSTTGDPTPLFQTANTCMACHNNLVTPSGQDVSIGTDWRATMMANSARDPYWMAAVRREIIDHPDARVEIEDECSICHMPMATYPARQAGGTGQIFARLQGGRQPAEADLLAADGVSCSVCHQIGAEKLGTPESYTGGYVIDTTRPAGDRPMYGPFQTDPGRAAVMRSAIGFVPAEGKHMQSSEVCATCHTLLTSALGPNHETLGTLPEQTPYLEWQHSAYRESQNCQSCHMPVVAEAVPARPECWASRGPRCRATSSSAAISS